MHLINGEDKCRKKTNQSHIRKNVQAPRKYMAESTLNMKVKKTINSLNTVTLNIAIIFRKVRWTDVVPWESKAMVTWELC